jgi:hypothetical protein
MKKNLHVLALCAFLIIAPALTFAAGVFDIQYPIAELGSCNSREECKAFCDSPDNELTCLKWAQDNGFAQKSTPKQQPQQPGDQDRPQDQNRQQNENMNEGDGNEQQRTIDEEAFRNAPGGCKTPRECDMYCRVEEHLGECLDYSVKYGYSTQEEADKILAQSKKGGPGGCKGPEQCDAFCKQPANARACMQFVVDEGKITQEEAEVMISQMEKGAMMKGKKPGEEKGPGEPKIQKEKAVEVLKTKSGPGGCKNEEECKAYCEGGEHMEECMNFAKENKLMSDEDLQKMEKLSKGGPGGCKGPEQCDAFCSKEENRETCMNFSKENGLISEEEIQMMEKQMSIMKKLDKQAGPGGCRSREECNTFCSDQNNIETCLNFSGQQGMLSPDAVKQMMGQSSEAKQKMQQIQQYQQRPPMDQQRPQGKMMFPQKDGGEQFTPPQDCKDGNCPPPQDGQYRSKPYQGGDQQESGQYGQPPQGEYPQYPQQPRDCKDGNCPPPTGMNDRPQYQPQQEQYPPQQQEGQYMPPPPTGMNEGQTYQPPQEGQYGQPQYPQQPQYAPQPRPSGDDQYQRPGTYIPPQDGQNMQPPPTGSGENIPPPQPLSYKAKNMLANVLLFFLGK